MLSNYIFANLGFALSVVSSLVFFATGWLYLDSWKIDKQTKGDLLRSIGFFLLALISITDAVAINISVLTLAIQIVKIAALFLIAISLSFEPALIPPQKIALIFPFLLLSNSLIPLSTVLFFWTGLLYFRKSTEGRASEIKPIALAFFLFALAELITVSSSWQGNLNPFLSQALRLYGPVWITTHLIELLGLVLLAKWTLYYLRFRANAQLFILAISASFGFFILTAISFTFLLLHNIELDTLSHLRTDVRVVQYAVERLQSEALASATAISENPEVKTAYIEKDSNNLSILTSKLMLNYNTNFLAVTDDTGKVVMRGEDNESIGDTLIFDPTVKSAIEGQRLTTVDTVEGAIAPRILIRASVPLNIDEQVVGAISTGFWIDNAFVDGVKSVTGLDIAVFGGNKRAATTFVAPDGQTRFTGSLESNPKVLETVLTKGEIFVGAANVLNKPYYTAYAPLKTYHGETIGMIFVGKLQTELFNTAQKSIQLTFIGSIILMILSIAPAYWISRYIKENVKA